MILYLYGTSGAKCGHEHFQEVSLDNPGFTTLIKINRFGQTSIHDIFSGLFQ